jgi:hypothetical protein
VLDFPEILNSSGVPVTIESDVPAGQSSLDIDLNGCSLVPLSEQVSADSTRQYITYSTNTTTPSGELAAYNLVDSINVDINMSEMTFLSITGYFNQDAIVERDVVALEEET